MILHLSQIFFTLARTFIRKLSFVPRLVGGWATEPTWRVAQTQTVNIPKRPSRCLEFRAVDYAALGAPYFAFNAPGPVPEADRFP
jgi:hypothetical protein